MRNNNGRAGLILFLIYLALYGGFVFLNAFATSTMETTLGGVNLAIWYGFGLIVAALVLALIYGWLSRAAAAPSDGPLPTKVEQPAKERQP